MKKHEKHKNLTKRNNGNFAPNEIAILGSKCAIISELVQNITRKLKNKYKIAYVDASHNFEKEIPFLDTFTFNKNGFVDSTKVENDNPYNVKVSLNSYDFTFINGNHYKANQQILILDASKEASVLKRLEQLNNVQFIITLDKNLKLFPFLNEKYPTLKNVLVYDFSETDKISAHIERLIQQEIPNVHGLVLIGGKSTRMGTDKSLLQYHNKPQGEYIFDLLKDSLSGVYYSVRDKKQRKSGEIIVDTFLDLGPFGGICSAFRENPNTAWLVIATDLPYIDKTVIDLLLQQRDSSKIATAFKGKNKQFPEPLITIWEPKAYPILLNYLAQGYSCPRKVLINNAVKIVEIDDKIIKNFNTIAEYESFDLK